MWRSIRKAPSTGAVSLCFLYHILQGQVSKHNFATLNSAKNFLPGLAGFVALGVGRLTSLRLVKDVVGNIKCKSTQLGAFTLCFFYNILDATGLLDFVRDVWWHNFVVIKFHHH